jgi:GH25 family lysozyme M1 (1,4-beta-N-acetylmuramidase)
MIAMKPGVLFPFCFLLVQCGVERPVAVSSRDAVAPSRGGALQQVINVSAYDPKRRDRDGDSYSENDVRALRRNGAQGLIARSGKGGKLDEKCAAFIAAADRAGLLAGVYYRVQRHLGAVRQADQFVDRARALNRRRPPGVAPLLLCGDYDGDLPLSSILAFMDRVEARTGVVPVAYLENSTALKQQTRAADARTTARLRRAPYWLALYSHESGESSAFPAPGHPDHLVRQYNLWPGWTMWQYGGVGWENGKSRAKVYHHGRYRFPKYFGRMDRPLERNVFRGSYRDLQAFWSRHGLAKS